MRKRLLILFTMILGGLMVSTTASAQYVYSESFAQGTTYCPGQPQYDNWGSFRASLDTSTTFFLTATIRGSLDPVGVTCSDATIVAQIAGSLKDGVQQSFTCGGIIWTVGNACITGCAVSGDDIELNAANTGSDCSCGGNLTVRPCIGNANWGSIGTGGCNAVTQVMEVEFVALSPYAVDANLHSIDSPVFPSCGGDTNVIVTVKQFGTDTLVSADIGWSVNGVAQTGISWTGNLGQFQEDDSVFVGSYNFQVGDVLKVWTSNPNMMLDSNSNNDTAQMTIPMPSMSGTYTINSAVATGGTNFQNFADAVIALDSLGVCDSVIINVAAGIYTEQIVLSEVVGMGPNAPVIFRGDPANNMAAQLDFQNFNFGTNYTMRIDGGDWYGFEDMMFSANGTTYSRVVDINGGAEHNWFKGCLIQGDLNTTTTSTNKAVLYSANGVDENNSFIDNEFRGGSYSVYWRGQGTTTTEEGSVFDGNLFSRWYYMGFYAWYHNNMKVRDNVFSTLSSYGFTSYGMYIWYSDGAQEVTGNRIEPINNVPRYSMYFVNCDATNANRGIVANNTVVGGDSNSTATFYAMYMSNSGYQEIVHNTFVLYGNGTFSRTLYIPSGGANRVLNNIIVNFGAGYAYYVNNSFAVVESDHNNIYAPNATNLAFFNGNQATLAAWTAASGHDQNSLSIDPMFYNWLNNDLHVCSDSLDGNGKDVQGLVTVDLDGQTRNSTTPDIGADEFSSLAGFTLGNANATICIGDSLQLWGATDGSNNVWSDNSMGDSLWVNQPGTYWVEINNACGTVSDTVIADFNQTVDLPNDTNLCAGDTGTINSGIPGAMYNWNNAATTQSIDVTTAGIYGVVVTDAAGCVSSDSMVVTVSEETSLISDTSFCEGDDYMLDAGLPGSSYIWTPGNQTSQTITVNTPGTYAVTVTDPFGCVSSATHTTTQTLLPTATFTHNVSFTAVSFSNGGANGTSYNWDFGDGTTSSMMSPTHIYPTQSTYIVTLTVTNDCGSAMFTDTVNTSNVGISELNGAITMDVYPNPNNGEFTLELSTESSELVNIQVIDLSGRVIQTQTLGNIQGEIRRDIDLGEVAKGVYFLKVDLGGHPLTQKISVQ